MKEEPNKKKKEEAEKIHSLFQQVAEKKTSVAKDQVTLKHVETKKQQVSQETLNLAETLKKQVIEHDHFERLSNDEMTILESFMGKRLLLTRIAIIVNQSRIPLGIPGFTKAELEKLLDGLTEKGYLSSVMVNENRVYILTERGQFRVQ